MTIALRAITADNFDDIAELELFEHQRDYLASNTYSIAQASFHPQFQTRAVYDDEAVIGFVMYVAPDADDPPGEYRIWRFMIDARRQGQGHGRRTLELVLDEIKGNAGAEKILIYYKPDNPLAKNFYASVGFVEIGMDDEDDMVAVISV